MTEIEKNIIEIAITVLLSIIVAARTTRQELKKIPYEIKKIYADNLQQHRIQLYPAYYGLLSELVKKIDRRTINRGYLSDWLEKFLKLDSEISIFLSGASANFAYQFYWGLENLITRHYDKNELTDKEFYNELYALRADKFETLLKIDLGIYIVEFDPKIGTQIKDYDTVDKLRKKNRS